MRQSSPPLTAGEIARRAERRLKTIGGVLLVLGCHSLTPKQQHSVDVFDCRVHALEPYVGDVVDVAAVVRQSAMGTANPVQVLNVLGVARVDIQQAIVAWDNCDPEIVAPPPGAGDKVL